MAEGFLAGPVFPDTEGGWLRKSNFTRKVFKPLLAKAKLPDVRFHDLRHGHATLAQHVFAFPPAGHKFSFEATQPFEIVPGAQTS